MGDGVGCVVSVAIGVGKAITVVEVEMTGSGVAVGTEVVFAAGSMGGTDAHPARIASILQTNKTEKMVEPMNRVEFQGGTYNLSELAGRRTSICDSPDAPKIEKLLS